MDELSAEKVAALADFLACVKTDSKAEPDPLQHDGSSAKQPQQQTPQLISRAVEVIVVNSDNEEMPDLAIDAHPGDGAMAYQKALLPPLPQPPPGCVQLDGCAGGVVNLRLLVTPLKPLSDVHINNFLNGVQNVARGKVLVLSTHFYPKVSAHDSRAAGGGALDEYDYARVKRWTRSKQLQKRAGVACIFGSGLKSVLIPIHVGNVGTHVGAESTTKSAIWHWFLAAVDLQLRSISCLDSARADRDQWDPSSGLTALLLIERWLQDQEAEEASWVTAGPKGQASLCISDESTTRRRTTKQTLAHTSPETCGGARIDGHDSGGGGGGGGGGVYSADDGGSGSGKSSPTKQCVMPKRWKIDLAPADAPQRDPTRDGDCGVFTCAAADWWAAADACDGKRPGRSGLVSSEGSASSDTPHCGGGGGGRFGRYGSQHMPAFRQRIAHALLTASADTRF
jgi:hypothetical protein